MCTTRMSRLAVCSGAGDIAGNSGQILSIQNTSTQALVKTVPLQW